MIILDIDEKDNLTAKVKGKRDEFYRTVSYLKNIRGSKFYPVKKVWTIPREIKIIEKLEQKFKVGSDYDRMKSR